MISKNGWIIDREKESLYLYSGFCITLENNPMNIENPEKSHAPDIVLAFVLFFVCLLLALFFTSDTVATWVGQ